MKLPKCRFFLPLFKNEVWEKVKVLISHESNLSPKLPKEVVVKKKINLNHFIHLMIHFKKFINIFCFLLSYVS